MNLNVTLFWGAWLLLGLFCCCPPPDPQPSLMFESVSKQSLVQGGSDSLFLTFSFVDGDGDIGSDTNNIQVLDSRTNSIIKTYKVPNYLGEGQGSQSGSITLVLHSTCCIYPNGTACQSSSQYPTREMRYQIRLIDQAGNWSNTIESTPIVLECS